jgi:hypothetical protein
LAFGTAEAVPFHEASATADSPKGNDRKKNKGKCKSRFPSGMTERKARANAKATEEADSLREYN